MKQLWQYIGTAIFWAAWPLLWVYLRVGQRTRVIITAQDNILLVKSWLGSGKWSLPGGGLHRGEAPLTGAAREVREETGLHLTPQHLTFLYEARGSNDGQSFRYQCFAAHLPKPVPLQKRLFEITDAVWIPLAKVLKQPLTKDTRQAVLAWKKHKSLL